MKSPISKLIKIYSIAFRRKYLPVSQISPKESSKIGKNDENDKSEKKEKKSKKVEMSESRVKKFHKIFGHKVPEDEKLLNRFSCALISEILL